MKKLDEWVAKWSDLVMVAGLAGIMGLTISYINQKSNENNILVARAELTEFARKNNMSNEDVATRVDALMREMIATKKDIKENCDMHEHGKGSLVNEILPFIAPDPKKCDNDNDITNTRKATRMVMEKHKEKDR